jgi:hypothetical protein
MNDRLTAGGKQTNNDTALAVPVSGNPRIVDPHKAPSNNSSVGILPSPTKKTPPPASRTKASGSKASEISPAAGAERRQTFRSIYGHARNSWINRPVSPLWPLHFPKRWKQLEPLPPYENYKVAHFISGLNFHDSASPNNGIR